MKIHKEIMSMQKQSISHSQNQSFDFYKNLEERFLTQAEPSSFKRSVQMGKENNRKSVNLNQSKVLNRSKVIKTEQQKTKEQSLIFVDMNQIGDKERFFEGIQNYDVKLLSERKEQIIEAITEDMKEKKSYFFSIQFDVLGKEDNYVTKTACLRQYCQQIVKALNKSVVSIYSKTISFDQTKCSNALISSQRVEIFDMLSIRRESKPDVKGLVKTNIGSNAKSHLIIKKLLDFASQRELIMKKQSNVVQLVIRIQPQQIPTGKENENKNEIAPIIQLKMKSSCLCESQCFCSKQSELFVKGMKKKIKILSIPASFSNEETLSSLQQYKKKPKQETEEELIDKIKELKNELETNKRELEKYRIKVQTLMTEEDEEEEMVPPSERIHIDVEKLRKNCVFQSKKGSQEEIYRSLD